MIYQMVYNELQGSDNVKVQISEHILKQNGEFCVHNPSNIFCNTHLVIIMGVFPSFSWGIFNHLTCLDRSHVKIFDGS